MGWHNQVILHSVIFILSVITPLYILCRCMLKVTNLLYFLSHTDKKMYNLNVTLNKSVC